VAELHLKMAQMRRADNEFDRAIEHYKLAIYQGVPDVAERAAAELAALRTYLADRPHKAGDLAALLERQGFVGSVWTEETPRGGKQVVRDQVLELAAPEGGAIAYRELIRPVRNFGFDARVEFRAGTELLLSDDGACLGLAVLGVRGDGFEVRFDGKGYSTVMTRNPGRVTARNQVAEARGDEGSRWHELGLNYNFQTGELRATLDGEQVCRYPIDLSDFRLRVFVRASAASGARGLFRGITCGPLTDDGRTA
jgi:hypothetical protein